MSRSALSICAALTALTFSGFSGQTAYAQTPPPPAVASGPSYAYLADLADSAPLVLRAQVRKMSALEPSRATGVRPGWGRFYIEARTKALISGSGALGESLRFLADLPLDERGRAPSIKNKEILVFARTGNMRPGELQLTGPEAWLLWDSVTENRLRSILMELNEAQSPARVTGVREAIHVPGNLAGDGETQIFLSTHNDSAASITVTRSANAQPHWGASFSEVFDPQSRPPAKDTLTWYRLACFLPRQLPTGVNLSATQNDQDIANRDYTLIIRDLGPCQRSRG